MTRRNDSATELWEQLFATMAKAEDAALVDPEHDEAEDEARLREGLAQAGWSEREIQQRVDLLRAQAAAAPSTSPGVNPHVESQFSRLCDNIEVAMDRLGMDSYARVARGIEPRLGPLAAKTSVIMTDQSIVTVGSFLFRFCGLVARAFTRTLLLAPAFWESAEYSDKRAQGYLKTRPELRRYWLSIFVSYALTGTHIMALFRPANRHEVMLFEQVARAMEIFAIAHEYAHHHLDHGRRLEDDPKAEEFDADQLALKIAYEVECKPFIFPNPYLSSGAGGVVLLLALKTLQEFKNDFLGPSAVPSGTHPDILARIARFDTVATLDREEFAALRGFRTASGRIMTSVAADLSNLRGAMPPEHCARLRELAQPY